LAEFVLHAVDHAESRTGAVVHRPHFDLPAGQWPGCGGCANELRTDAVRTGAVRVGRAAGSSGDRQAQHLPGLGAGEEIEQLVLTLKGGHTPITSPIGRKWMSEG